MSDRVDWRSDEFQNLLDLKPVKVRVKEGKPSVAPSDHTDRQGEPRTDSVILRYFGLPEAKRLDPGVVNSLAEIGGSIRKETEDPDEFFLMLEAIEKHLPEIDDPYLRIERIQSRIKMLRRDGALKRVLIESGALSLHDVEVDAARTGNWRRYLKLSKQHAEAVTK